MGNNQNFEGRRDGDVSVGIGADESAFLTVHRERIVVERRSMQFMDFSATSYVRFVDAKDEEIVYWDQEEWTEDPEVMTLILRCIFKGTAVCGYSARKGN